MILKLLPFQEIGRDFLVSKSNAILADDMGLGKTITSIEAMKKLNIPRGIIITPQTIRHTWIKVLKEQAPMIKTKEITSTKVMPEPNSVNVVNYDIVWREPLLSRIKENRWPLLIADESHYVKNIESKRAKAIIGKGGIYALCTRRWLLTGTPVLNRPIELYAPLRALRPEIMGEYRDYYRYAFRFCAGYHDVYGFNASGASNLDQLSQFLKPIMLRRTKEEVLPELPGITYEKIYLPPTSELAKIVDEENKYAESLSIKQALGMLKIKTANKHIEHLLLTKNKVVVFTWHTAVADGVKKHFRDTAVLHTGAETVKQKEKAREDFIRTDTNVRVFIGQLESTGVGVDGLQGVCDTALFIEIIGVPKKIEQAAGRLHRMGQKNNVLIQFLVAENSADEDVIDTLIEKSKNINKIMGEEGKIHFVGSNCAMCGKKFELHKLGSVIGKAVCDSCGKMLGCLT